MTYRDLERIAKTRRAMRAAQDEAERRAAANPQAVAETVERWKREEGLSIRKSAKRLALTESSLRTLLRPAGTARRR